MRYELSAFQNYVGVIPDAEAATALLRGFGIDASTADEFVARHRLLLRRIQVDMGHERERLELAQRHSAESELVELISAGAPLDSLHSLVRQILPSTSGHVSESRTPASVFINNQTFHAVHGNVQQTLGNSGPPADVAQVFHDLSDGSISAHQLAQLAALSDTDLPRSRRQQAAAGLKAFLLRAKDRIEGEAFRLGFAWVNNQIEM